MKGSVTTTATRLSWAQRAVDLAELCKARLSALVLATVAVGWFAAVATGAASVATGLGFLAALIGVSLTAAGAAALNQFLERDLDARMQRTKDRPLPSGRMNPDAALALGLVLCVGGIVALHALVGPLAALLGASSAVLYVGVYTPLKRVTTFNTLVGAVTGALPPMIGWVAATGRIDTGAVLLFAILFVWQLPHFFAIAWLYREDYRRAGMCMLGVGDEEGGFTMRQILLFSVTMLPVSLMPAFTGMAGPIYFGAAIVLGLGFVGLSVRLCRTRGRGEARHMFLGSLVYLPCLLGLLLFDCMQPGGF